MSTPRKTLTGDEYIALLQERQSACIGENPPPVPWMQPLLEWFVQPGDEDLFTPPEGAPS